jgi:hypothetical protein
MLTHVGDALSSTKTATPVRDVDVRMREVVLRGGHLPVLPDAQHQGEEEDQARRKDRDDGVDSNAVAVAPLTYPFQQARRRSR